MAFSVEESNSYELFIEKAKLVLGADASVESLNRVAFALLEMEKDLDMNNQMAKRNASTRCFLKHKKCSKVVSVAQVVN